MIVPGLPGGTSPTLSTIMLVLTLSCARLPATSLAPATSPDAKAFFKESISAPVEDNTQTKPKTKSKYYFKLHIDNEEFRLHC